MTDKTLVGWEDASLVAERRRPGAQASGQGGGPRELKKLIAKGLRYSVLQELGKDLELGSEELAALVRLSPRTLQRRKESGLLDPAATDRALRIAELRDFAVELFDGDRAAARDWLKRPNPALEDLRPLDLMGTEAGSSLVEGLIGRLASGVFS